MKIAIIGAGLAGLACARECEKQGIIPDVFERYDMVGWIWPSINVQSEVFTNRFGKDILCYLKDEYGLSCKPLGDLTNIIFKSPNEEAGIEGKSGYLFCRGKHPMSLENELFRDLKTTPVHLNRPADYKELSRKYDYVVVADGKDIVAKELGVWEDCGRVYIYAGIARGSFVPGTSTVYFNTGYAGTGYARISPFDASKAMVAIYVIGYNYNEFDLPRLFIKFLETQGLAHLEFFYQLVPPVFSTGRVNKFQAGNVLLAGRAAGLIERIMGEGSVSSLVSGVMAANQG